MNTYKLLQKWARSNENMRENAENCKKGLTKHQKVDRITTSDKRIGGILQ